MLYPWARCYVYLRSVEASTRCYINLQFVEQKLHVQLFIHVSTRHLYYFNKLHRLHYNFDRFPSLSFIHYFISACRGLNLLKISPLGIETMYIFLSLQYLMNTCHCVIGTRIFEFFMKFLAVYICIRFYCAVSKWNLPSCYIVIRFHCSVFERDLPSSFASQEIPFGKVGQEVVL